MHSLGITTAAGSLFGFQRGAGDLDPAEKSTAILARRSGQLGALTAIVIGIWLFYRGVTSPKKLNLQTFGGLFLFGNGVGALTSLSDPDRAAKGFALMAQAMRES